MLDETNERGSGKHRQGFDVCPLGKRRIGYRAETCHFLVGDKC